METAWDGLNAKADASLSYLPLDLVDWRLPEVEKLSGGTTGVTVRFCDRYIDKRSRTHDQMVQAARAGP